MTIKNRTVFTRDNIEVLRGMDTASVDLIYLDPPFNSNRHYSAPLGSEAAGASFKDAWTFEDTDAAWWGEISDEHPSLYKVIDAGGAAGGKGDQSYLIYMAARLLEMHRVLKDSGSIYLHCDPVMSHSLKLMMDAIFGKKNFRNEVIWNYRRWTSASAKKFQRMHDVLLFYAKSPLFRLNAVYVEPTAGQKLKHDKGWDTNSVLIDGRRQRCLMIYDQSKVNAAVKEGKLDLKKFALAKKVEETQTLAPDVWDLPYLNSQAKERVGYPTQKPLALLKRIISASSNKNDVVFDPFCGCATTLIAAEMLGRRWLGIDISARAAELVKIRAEREIGGLFPLVHRTDIPQRADARPRSRNIKHILFGMQEGLCNGCKTSFPFRNFTIDHIVPLAKGGSDTDDNLQLLCGYCNSVKGERGMEYLRAQLRAERHG